MEIKKNTLWSETDVAVLSNQCENQVKTIQRFDERAKEWGVYNGLDQLIKSMSSTIPIMDQLHHDKLRERHWKRFEEVTAVDFQHSADLKTGDILSQNLIGYSDNITEIVDSATDEVRTETQLAEVDKMWREMNF
jgi:dynein heavy chain